MADHLTQLAEASAHGRFQPPHLGHLEYLLAAKQQCSFLWIGITQYLTSTLQPVPQDPHREKPFNNPLTYFERGVLIRAMLEAAEIDPRSFSILPFPIDEPNLIHDFLPPAVPVFTTIYDEWNRHKIKVLEEAGYTVRVLWESESKEYMGSEVRRLILADDQRWKTMVPTTVAEGLDRLDIRTRLASLADG